MCEKGIYQYSMLTEEEEGVIPHSVPNHLLSLVTFKIIPTEKPSSLAHVVVSKNNTKKGEENWNCQMVIPRKFKEYLDENEEDRFEIRFVYNNSTYDTIHTRFIKAFLMNDDSSFLNFEFIYPHPIKSCITQYSFKTFSVRVGFASTPKIDHYLFRMVIFQKDFPKNFKLKVHKSYYEALEERKLGRFC